MLYNCINLVYQSGQKESVRWIFLAVALAMLWFPVSAQAQGALDSGGLTFKDFATEDNGSSFSRSSEPGASLAKVLTIDTAKGLARLRFDTIKTDVAVPLGWQASEDWERGVAHSVDRRYRLVAWRVDFAFEGVTSAEQYAASKIGAIRSRRPTVQAQARKLADETFLIAYENVPAARGDSEPRAVFDLVLSNPRNVKEGVLITLGVPTSDNKRGLGLLALVKSEIRIDW